MKRIGPLPLISIHEVAPNAASGICVMTTASSGTSRKIMAIASGGGHWIELRRLAPAFDDLDVFYVSTDASLCSDVEGKTYYPMRDVSRRDRLGIVVLMFQLLKIILKEQPHVVITTGSAPALIGLALSKLCLRSRTIWIESIVSIDHMSMSGQMARWVADRWLVQWEHLARPGGPEHWGAVL